MSMAKVTVCGYIGEPKPKYTAEGKKVIEFSVAHNPTKEGEPMWFNCAIWEPGEKFDWLAKGMGVMVRGRYSDRIYNDKIYRNITVEEINVFGKGQAEATQEEVF